MAMLSFEPLRQHLVKENENGSPTAILFAQVALFVISLFLNKTAFISKHDGEGIKSALSYHIVALLLPCSKFSSRLKFLLPRSWGGLEVNFTMTCALLLLAIPLENYYEKSVASLGVVLSTAVLAIVLRVIIRPRNDFGVLGFLFGAAVSIACNLYKSKKQTWVVFAICIGLGGVRFFLVQNWPDDDENEGSSSAVEAELPTSGRTTQENKRIISKSTIIQALLVPVFYLYWDLDLLIRSNCCNCAAFSINSCSKSCLKGLAACLVVLVLWVSLTAIALGLYPLLISLVSSSNKVNIAKKSDFDSDEEIEVKVVAADDKQKGKTEDKVDAADDRQKQKIEDKVEDDRQKKGKTKDKVEKGKTEEDKIIKSESHRTSDTLRRRRPNDQSKVTASFSKILERIDLERNLVIPAEFMQHLPNIERGRSVSLNVLDASSGEQFQFGYYIRSSGQPKPVFRGGWIEYGRKKGLRPGDQITFGCLDNGGLPSYTIRAERTASLLGREVGTAEL